MKKSVITIIAIILSVALLATSAAAVMLYVSRAKVSFLTGRVENLGTANPNTPSDLQPTLTIRSEDGDPLGDNADISPDGEVEFPILSDVTATTVYGKPSIWTSAEGEEPIHAPTFIVSSENGESRDVTLRIAVHGSDPSRAALRFGVDVKYYANDLQQTVVRNGIMELNHRQSGETVSTDSIPLGDGNIAENEDIEVFITVWVDKKALHKVGVYPNDEFRLEAIFTSGETTTQ